MTHLQELNITYIEHFKQAFSYSITSFKASIIFAIHAFFPNLLITTGSKMIKKLNEKFIKSQ
jgi:hypothetical protein